MVLLAVMVDFNIGNLQQTHISNASIIAGREYIAQLGLYDYRNRVYSPVYGRFLQTDPIRFQGGDHNIYRYCGNNPINGTDPLRLCGGPFSPSVVSQVTGAPDTSDPGPIQSYPSAGTDVGPTNNGKSIDDINSTNDTNFLNNIVNKIETGGDLFTTIASYALTPIAGEGVGLIQAGPGLYQAVNAIGIETNNLAAASGGTNQFIDTSTNGPSK